jgi:hypothetical protein
VIFTRTISMALSPRSSRSMLHLLKNVQEYQAKSKIKTHGGGQSSQDFSGLGSVSHILV